MLRRVRLLAFLIVPVALLTMSCHKKVSQGWLPPELGSNDLPKSGHGAG